MQKYVLSELDSGERVISEKVPGVRSVSLGFWIGAGSRDERGDRAGVSHFIEHLLFKGSRSYDAQQIAETFDAMGAELNAATSREHTVVYSRVPDQHVDTALEVMTDMVFAPVFAEVDQEREVVLEEIAMYEDTPQELVHDLFSDAVFGSHALGRPVIGTADVISTISKRAIAGYHRSMYTGGNIVVSAAGNITHEKFVSLLERFEARSAVAARATPHVRRPIAQLPAPGLRFQRKDTEQYHLCLGAPGIARTDRRRFAASLLDSILGGSASSRLFQEIREKRGMAYAVYSFASQYTDTGLVGVYVGTREENLAPCVEICV
ncbi:MAG TPA: pitrilysin family protein, partial [Gaiellaceae bacterium]